MKVRIQNDGTAQYNTKITNAETGEDIEHVLRVDIKPLEAQKEMVEAVITIALPMIDVIADAEIRHVCPYCGSKENDATST